MKCLTRSSILGTVVSRAAYLCWLFIQKGRDTLSDKKLKKLRISLDRLKKKSHGLKVQVNAAQSGGRCRHDTTTLDRLKKEKLACKDEIAAVQREIDELEAELRAPKLVYQGEPSSGGQLPSAASEARLAASA